LTRYDASIRDWGRQMRRREIIALLGGAAAGWPLPALAQAGGTRRVGVLLAFDESDPRPQAWLATFTQSLAKLGWTAGRDVQIEIRWAGNDVELMRKFAKELVAAKPNVILAFGTPVTAALQRETRTIPIVFAIVSDPVGDGFVRQHYRLSQLRVLNRRKVVRTSRGNRART
jgi:putative ABC transport system substrate-binding protein